MSVSSASKVRVPHPMCCCFRPRPIKGAVLFQAAPFHRLQDVPEFVGQGMEDGPQRVRFGKADRCPRTVRPAGYAA
jgi:hypothetical protein